MVQTTGPQFSAKLQLHLQGVDGTFPSFTASSVQAQALWKAAEEVISGLPSDSSSASQEGLGMENLTEEGFLLDPKAGLLFALGRLSALQVRRLHFGFCIKV